MEKKILIISLIILVIGSGLIYSYENKQFEKRLIANQKCWDIYNEKSDELGHICTLSHWDYKTNKSVQGNCHEKKIKQDLLYHNLTTCTDGVLYGN